MNRLIRPTVERSLLAGAVLATALLLDLFEPTRWTAVAATILSIGSLFFLLVTPGHVFNVLTALVGRPVALTARARSSMILPDFSARQRFTAGWWTFLMVASVILRIV